MRKGLIYAWSSLLCSYLALIALDYCLRDTAGNIKTGGIDFFLFWALWIPFLIFSLYWLFNASKNMKTKFIRMLFILSNLLVATLIVLVISLLYTVGFGIDSL
jgi:hypothetical protein